MPSSPNPVPRPSVINPDADRRLTRMALLYGGVSFALLLAVTFGMPILNFTTHLPLWPKRLLNYLSLLVVLVPFFVGVNRMNAARLEIARERVQARAWTEAIAALITFDTPFQRFLDASGEAHYLLGQAYAGVGDKVRAEKARAYVRRKKDSPWAEKLQPSKGPGISRTASRSNAKAYNAKTDNAKTSNAKVYDAEEGGQEKRPVPPKTKPRRRF